MAQQPFKARQSVFSGGITSESSEARTMKEEVSHCHDIKNFYIDNSGKLNKRKGAVFALTTTFYGRGNNGIFSIPFGEDEAIVETELVDASAYSVIMVYYIGSVSNPEGEIIAKKIEFTFTDESPYFQAKEVV